MPETVKPFTKFCLQQTMRLESLGNFPFADAAIIEIRNFLEDHAGGSEDRVKRTIEECLEMDSRPTLPDVKRVWNRLHPIPNTTGCERCKNHVGYVVIERSGVTGSHRCECGAVPPLEYGAKSEAA